MIEICVHAADEHRMLAAGTCAVLRAALAQLSGTVSGGLALVLTGDSELQQLNRTYRGQDAPTDVLSFEPAPLPTDVDEGDYLGDIVISIPFAVRNAEAVGQSLEQEVHLLAVHGLLHLLGYDDATEEGAARMRQIECELGVRGPD